MDNVWNWFVPTKSTWLHNVNPALKFVILMTMMIFLFFSRNTEQYILLFISFSILLWTMSGFPLRKLALLHIPIVISAISSAVTLLLFGRGKDVVWQWGIMKISNESIASAALIGSKSILLGIISLILLLTTSPTLLLYSLMQQLRLPAKYVYAFMAGIRLIPMIIEEFNIRTQALNVRRVQLRKGFRSIYNRMKLYLIPLLAQSIRRAHRIAISMEAKQFQAKRTYYYVTRYSVNDVILLVYVSISIIITYSFN
ncbi:energy-coupling factor transporter transmembrane component T family protein [Paenibacillus endoradicis]|uniref:energy-coupling factor transporter transmembrane component T family protein n=1 Tax=Paenibacillus endoradicis TaxID=2972487 RepID=UPI0021594022|nr:energy-coupling factor transporter transmembrane component T [Paenibacillus endoradicis]MCR8655820.1 energy-coupling factor transporter transmembrane protein EcfT [Paenibacillus endoradicis]MCR8658146.1 energy-coupling factor transporter transmembrane protein EcfT [Paenibacillus endoradicis]